MHLTRQLDRANNYSKNDKMQQNTGIYVIYLKMFSGRLSHRQSHTVNKMRFHIFIIEPVFCFDHMLCFLLSV